MDNMDNENFKFQTSGGTMTSCFCTGACTELGYCPSAQLNTVGWTEKMETPSEKAYRLGVKVYEDKAKDWSPQNPNPITGVCGRCGAEVRVYNNASVCQETDCPAGIGLMLMNC